MLYTLVQQLENNLLVPKIQGDAVELHPAAVMFAIIIGGALAGLLGAILALPVTAAGARRRALPVPPAQPGRTRGARRLDRGPRPRDAPVVAAGAQRRVGPGESAPA